MGGTAAAQEDKPFAVAVPTVSLPKGGGAIRGIDEKFATNPVTGTGAMSLPIATSPGRGGSDPQLALSYHSGAGNGPFGTEDDAFVWHPALAEAEFGPARCVVQALDEEHGPRLVFADETQSVYPADMSGDGLTDLARIRNGEVCYRPNLGMICFLAWLCRPFGVPKPHSYRSSSAIPVPGTAWRSRSTLLADASGALGHSGAAISE
jgi:hypothetical protein